MTILIRRNPSRTTIRFDPTSNFDDPFRSLPFPPLMQEPDAVVFVESSLEKAEAGSNTRKRAKRANRYMPDPAGGKPAARLDCRGRLMRKDTPSCTSALMMTLQEKDGG